MRRGSVKNWPPVWTPLTTPGTQALVGEIGVLANVTFRDLYPLRRYLTIEHKGEKFMGTLLFDDPSVCWFIRTILKRHTRRSIEDIGGLDLSYAL
jgi:hypothetical protein